MKCGPENFTEILTDHGVCFTFNSNHGQPLYVLSTGAEYGLKLTLNVEQYEYMPGPHDAAGVKMLLHDSKEFPGVAELGLAMPTGTHAYVGIQVVQIENLPEPHGDCASQSSPYYQDYSYDNCQMACLTGLLEDTCGCRNHFMPHTLGAPPICTLEQYYGCYMKVIDELKQRVREDCACPVPCDFLIFDPALSFATTSVFATDRLLAAAWRSGDLGERYLAAMETTQRMERIKLSRFQALERDAQLRLHNLSDVMLRGVKDTIERAEVTLGEVSNATHSVWDRKHYLYRWQAYHVQKNFIRARDAMDERTFDYLAMGFQEIGNLTASRIWALADPNVTSPGAREALYLTVVTSLHAKMDLCDRALDNYTQLYSAYFNGTPIFRYKFVRELRNDNVFVTPTHLLHTALNHNSYALKYGARLGTDIERFRDTLARFVQLATQAFDNGTVDTEDMYHADVQFMWRGRRYLHSKSTFDEECIEYPLRVLEDRMTSFERLLRNYDDIMTESLRNIVSLKASLADLEDSILTRLNHSMRLASDYFTVGNLSKLEIARELTSQNIYVGISDLKVFFQSLRSRGQKVYDNWDKIAEATNAIWQVVIDDEDMLEYYTYKNMTHFLRNATEVAMENREVFNDYRQEFDFRFLIGSSDSLFLKSLQDLMSDMEGYLQTSVIGTDFIRENFLQLDVFYREKSYEQITQQIGYDEFALLCEFSHLHCLHFVLFGISYCPW
ncbi:hypothetical protein V1264_006986 [Littorina saxatilis]|uniref:Uncharacterized protein n=1 Tax=Littorina saxatilis TaxID=31220 RepID=A0AAN9AV87_9CAEN